VSAVPQGETTLYRIFDKDDELLYVGISCQVGWRIFTHSKEKRWWPRARHFTTTVYPTRRLALDAEWEAIDLENPLYNAHRPQPYLDPRIFTEWDDLWHDTREAVEMG
jgi:excinuclease UvrABC nuclease subunit